MLKDGSSILLETGGILPGDIVEEIAGQPVRSVQHIAALIDTYGSDGKRNPHYCEAGGQ